MIEYFQEDGAGDIFIANGIGPMLRWDGYAASFEEVGLAAPLTAMTLADLANGAIVGTYFAYTRFVDAKGNVSNLSPISAEFTASGSTGTITAATNTTPIVITSAGHGLATGDVVKITGVGGNTSANNTFVVTVLTLNTFELDDSSGTAEYTGGGTWISGVESIIYNSIPVPVEAKVVRRQILRNTDGQATTFYVDIDTTDLASASLSSMRDDSELQTQEAVPILDSELNLFANRHDKPSNYYPFMAYNLDRMFACGVVTYSRGHVKVTNGSTTVTGVGTDWESTLATRYLYVSGASKTYEISSVNETLQTLTLTEAYTDTTDKFAFYAIEPPPAFHRLVSFTEAGLPQSWPPTNAVPVQVTGDRFTGLAQHSSFIYIFEARHLHKLTFSVSPLIDGGVFMAAERGCVNGRSWIAADNALFSIDELGVYSFSAREVEPLSQQVQAIFRPQRLQRIDGLKINWKRKAFFHASLDRQQDTIRWFVCMDGHRYPHDALCFQYRQNKFWIERFPFAICGSCNGDINGTPQVFYGGPHSKILAAWQGTLDLANLDLGTVHGTATSSTLFSLTDSAASFSTTFANAPVSIVKGKGKGQVRKIIEASATTLTIQDPWLELPDATSVYQVGGVHYKYRTGWMRFAKAEENANRALELSWEPLTTAAIANLRFILDTTDDISTSGVTQNSDAGGGIASIKGLSDLEVNLTYPPGVARAPLPGHREHAARGRRYVQFELEGDSNEEPIIVYQWIFEGVVADTSPTPS